MRISDWSSDVCSSDLNAVDEVRLHLGQLLLAEPIPVGNVVYGYHATDSKQRKQERGHHEIHDAPGAVTVVGMQRTCNPVIIVFGITHSKLGSLVLLQRDSKHTADLHSARGTKTITQNLTTQPERIR